jgi:hypothetical protein
MARPFAGDAPDHADKIMCESNSSIFVPATRPVEDSRESFLYQIFMRSAVRRSPDSVNPVERSLVNAFGVFLR